MQIAPLVITPLILKFSGGLLGRIAQIANNPNKGLVDRSRKWAEESRGMHRNKVAGKNLDGKSKINPLNYGTRMVKASEFRQRKRKMNIENAEQAATAEINKAMATQGTNLNQAMVKLEDAKINAELESQRIEVMKAEFKSGQYEFDPTDTSKKTENLRTIQTKMAERVIETTALKRAVESAGNIQQQEYAKAVKDNITVGRTGKALQQIAAGIDPDGAQRAIASATVIIDEIRKKTIGNMRTIIDDNNLDSGELLDLAKGISVKGIAVSQDSRAAAIQKLFSGPDTGLIMRGMKEVDFSFNGLSPENADELRIIAASSLEGNGSKPTFLTAGAIGMMKQGQDFSGAKFTGAYGDKINDMVMDVIGKGKIDSGKLQSAGNDYATAILEAVKNRGVSSISNDMRKKLIQHLDITLDPNREAFEKLGDSEKTLKKLRKLL